MAGENDFLGGDFGPGTSTPGTSTARPNANTNPVAEETNTGYVDDPFVTNTQGTLIVGMEDAWTDTMWKSATDVDRTMRYRDLVHTRSYIHGEMQRLAGGIVYVNDDGQLMVGRQHTTGAKAGKAADPEEFLKLVDASYPDQGLSRKIDLAALQAEGVVRFKEGQFTPGASTGGGANVQLSNLQNLWDTMSASSPGTPGRTDSDFVVLSPDDLAGGQKDWNTLYNMATKLTSIGHELGQALRHGIGQGGDITNPNGYGAEKVRSYLDVESDKASEAARQLEDYVNRAKAIYDFQDRERAFAAWAHQTNEARGVPWNPTWGLGQQYNPNMAGPKFSDELIATLPEGGPPSLYSLAGAVGLPGGQEGFGPTLPKPNTYDTAGFDESGGITNAMPLPDIMSGEDATAEAMKFMSGYAGGTEMPQGYGYEPLPPELHWMIGMPNWKGPKFEWKEGDTPRGFVDQSIRGAQV